MLIHSDGFASHSSKRSSAGSLHNSSAAEAQTPGDVAVDNEAEEYYMVYAKDRMNATNMETTEAGIRQIVGPSVEIERRKIYKDVLTFWLVPLTPTQVDLVQKLEGVDHPATQMFFHDEI
jgi:hypothetical protein